MRVAIVGAGASGLASARALKYAGHDVVIFEKSHALGGRIATRRVGDYIFDSGASSIVPRGLMIQNVMLNQLPTESLVKVQKPIFLQKNYRISAGDESRNAVARYTYLGGNNTLAKLLAVDLDIRLEHKVDEIERKGNGFTFFNEYFDKLILTGPIPQVSQLLYGLGESRAFANSSYRSCLSILLGFPISFEPNYHALIDPEGLNPLIWVGIEKAKCADRAPKGHSAIVAQWGARFSQTHYEDSDDSLIDWTLTALQRTLGPYWKDPDAKSIKRWKYSQPEGIASFEAVNRPGSNIIVASDGLLGGRIEQAYECGHRAALLLIAQEGI